MEREVGLEWLHVHSDFSLLDGYSQVEEYADKIPKINMKYLTITDHGMMAAIPRQIRACEVVGIKPIFGIELYMNDMHCSKEELGKLDLTVEEKMEFGKNYHLLALSYTNEGYSNLVQLSSKAWQQFYKKPRVKYDQIDQHKKGIIFTSSCYIGEIGQAFDRYGPDKAQDVLDRYIAWFSPNFYLEIMLLDFKKQRAYNAWLVEQHYRTGIPILVSQDCLVRKTTVITDKGNKYIEDVVVGDKVLSHNNVFKSVEVINKRRLNSGEKIYRVKSAMGTFAWEVTGNHLVRVAKVGSKKWNIQSLEVKSYEWKRVDELIKGDYLVVPKIKECDVFSDTPLEEIDLFDYVNDSDISFCKHKEQHDHGCSLIYDKEIESFVSFQGFDRRCKIIVPRYIKIDNDILKIFGLYMAEGGLDKEGTVITFGLHKDELEEKALIENFFGKFGITVTKYEQGNGVKLSFSSKLFRRFFEKICGIGATGKHFPLIKDSVFRVFSKDQFLKIFSQYWKGDGAFGKFHERISTVASVSKKMIYDLAVFVNALGFPVIPQIRECNSINTKHKNPKANPDNWNDVYVISFGSNTRVRIENLVFEKNVQEKHKVTNSGARYVEDDQQFVTKFVSMTEIEYDDFVYNFQVKDDESYTANMFQVHNCHYSNKTDSQQQRRMLMIRGKKTEKDFENLEDGRDYFELQDSNLWLKSEEELDEKYLKRESDGFCYRDIIPPEIYTQAKRNTVEVARKASGVEIDRSIKLPQIPDADAKLKEAAMAGYKWRGLGLRNKYINRLTEEINLICKKGFSAYFLIQQEIIKEARRVCPQLLGWGNGDEAIGPGRGSCVGSLVCYCLGITDVDPLKHDLLFSRFLSEARGGRELRTKFTNIPIPDDIYDEEIDSM